MTKNHYWENPYETVVMRVKLIKISTKTKTKKLRDTCLN